MARFKSVSSQYSIHACGIFFGLPLFFQSIMNVLGCFEHAFVLNLPMDTCRMDQTREELVKHEIPFERLEGVTLPGPPRGLERGRRGCLLAHLSAVREARLRGYKSVVIIEDDIIFQHNFHKLWPNVIPQIAGLDYELFYLYRWARRDTFTCPVQVVQIKRTLCTHFYAMHCSFYEKCIAAIEGQLRRAWPRPIDWLLHLHAHKIYATSYNLVGQRAGPSNISPNPRKRNVFN